MSMADSASRVLLAVWLSRIGSSVLVFIVGLVPIPLGTADTLIHHIHAFTIHVTALILLKGVLFARGSRLIADKALLGFRFP